MIVRSLNNSYKGIDQWVQILLDEDVVKGLWAPWCSFIGMLRLIDAFRCEQVCVYIVEEDGEPAGAIWVERLPEGHGNAHVGFKRHKDTTGCASQVLDLARDDGFTTLSSWIPATNQAAIFLAVNLGMTEKQTVDQGGTMVRVFTKEL